MDAISDEGIIETVCIKGTQVGWTEALNNSAAFFIDQDPCTILVIQPSLELAEAWSKDRFAPMVRDTPALAAKVRDPKERDSGNTIRHKLFPGGRITMIGANAPRGLAARPIRVVLADEVDGYPVSAGTEGDPLALAAKRQQTYWNRKTLIGSTPLLKITSVVWRKWLQSDQRRYHVPCPHCDWAQQLRWSNVRWDKDEKGEHRPESAYYLCEHCGATWSDVDRWNAISEADRRARAGDDKTGWIASREFNGSAGFHVPGFLSPWLTLEEIVREFLKARKDPQLLQVWVNTVLGEPWEEASEKVDGAGLSTRGEVYGPESVPEQVQIVTAGVDVQHDRLELQVLGFGVEEECWALRYEVIHGDPAQKTPWDELDQILRENYTSEGGRLLRVRACCIDTGGHHGEQVFAFCRPRRSRRVFPIKGFDGAGRPIWPKRVSTTKNKRTEFFAIGVDVAKDAIYGRLRITKPGPGYIHFPNEPEFGPEYFRQLTAEQVVTRKREGRPYRVWILPSGRRNEALDTFVYALAARHSIPVLLSRPRAAASRSPPPSREAEGEPRPIEPDIGRPAGVPPPSARPPLPRWIDRPPDWVRRGSNWWGNR